MTTLPPRALGRLLLPAVSLCLLAGPAAASASEADLSAQTPQAQSGSPGEVGGTGTYYFQLYNAGPDQAADVTAAVTLGDAEALVDVSPDTGSCTTAVPVTCSFGALAGGESRVITLHVRFTKPSATNGATVQVNGGAGNADPEPANDKGGMAYPVAAATADETASPQVTTGEWSRTQTRLKLEAEVAPHGDGQVSFEWGRTKAYGNRTTPQAVSGDATRTVKATLAGLKMSTGYHYRAVLVAGGRTYRGKDVAARTMGKLKYGPLTLKAVKRTATSVSYTGELGDGYADAPGACVGSVAVEVYTLQGATLLRKRTRMGRDCSYRITIPFGRKQASRYGKRGQVLTQARFSGTKAVSSVGSSPDRP